MNLKFSEWLIFQMQERGWSQSDMARKSGLTRQAISYYLSDKSKSPDESALRKIANALKLSPEQVFRAAGLLPPKPDSDQWVEDMEDKIKFIRNPGRRSLLLNIIEKFVEQEEAEDEKKLSRSKAAKRPAGT